MSDFSFFSLFTAGLACLSVVNAYTQPKGDAPEGNPISEPGLNSVVPAGEPFTVTWEPTTKGTVTLVLLKGPSTDAEPQYALIEKTPNTGTFVWTPKTDLAPSDPSTPAQGYGIQLIDDATGQYQYTTQFGISNSDYKASSSSSSSESSKPTSSETKSASGYKTTEAPVYTTTWVKDYTTVCPEATKLTMGNHTYTVSSATTLTITDCSCTITKPAHSTTPVAPVGTGPVGTGSRPSVGITPAHNVTMVAPTGYAPTSLSTSATYNAPSVSATPSSSIPVYKGAASTVATSFAGLIIAAGAVVLAL